MIRTYIGLPPLPPPSSPPLPLSPLPFSPPSSPPPHPISTDASGMHRQSFADVHQCISEVSQKLRRCITDHLSEQSTIVTECAANIRLRRRCFGEHSPNHYKSIFSSELLVFYTQNRKASWSIACIIIHFTIADAKIPNGTEALLLKSLQFKFAYPSKTRSYLLHFDFRLHA